MIASAIFPAWMRLLPVQNDLLKKIHMFDNKVVIVGENSVKRKKLFSFC